MKLLRERFDGGNDTECGAIHSVADQREVAILDSVENAPAREICERVDAWRGFAGMRFSEDEKFGLLVDYFFEAYLRPILRRIDDGSCAGVEQRVGDERFSANGNERL